ncbi:MAG: DUF6282 family protein [Nitrospinota bacterium]
MRMHQPDVISLEGAIDIHFHPHPDLIPRLTDDRGAAERALECGLRAVVLKCHFESTVGRAYDVGQQFGGIDVYGGIVLNRHTGGVNPAAVETSVRLGAKVVWMPTVDADYHAEVYGFTGSYDKQRSDSRPVEPISIVKDGKLTQACQDVLDILAHYDSAALATGHFSAKDVGVLVREAVARRVRRVIMQHVFFKIPAMSIEQVKELTALGAVAEVEYCGISPFWAWEGQTLEGMRRGVAEVGAEHFLLISDGGQRHNPLPSDCLRLLAQGLYEKGVTRAELRRMMTVNPAEVLGI